MRKKVELSWIATQIKSGPVKVQFYTKQGEKLAFKALKSGPMKIEILIKEKDWLKLQKYGKTIKIY